MMFESNMMLNVAHYLLDTTFREGEESPDLRLRKLEDLDPLNRAGRVGRHAASNPICTSKENQNIEKVVMTTAVRTAF
jgi:hypothetical protein